MADMTPAQQSRLAHLRRITQLRQLRAQDEEDSSSGGGAGLSGKFIEFLKEMGDTTVRNPDTNNWVKLKSLKGDRGKDMQRREFRKWVKKQRRKRKPKDEKSKGGKPKDEKSKDEKPKDEKSKGGKKEAAGALSMRHLSEMLKGAHNIILTHAIDSKVEAQVVKMVLRFQRTLESRGIRLRDPKAFAQDLIYAATVTVTWKDMNGLRDMLSVYVDGADASSL